MAVFPLVSHKKRSARRRKAMLARASIAAPSAYLKSNFDAFGIKHSTLSHSASPRTSQKVFSQPKRNFFSVYRMSDNTLVTKRIAKNTLFLYLRMFLIMAINLYTSRVVLKALGVVDYGVYNVVGGVVSMFSFLNTALAQATQRYIAFGIGRESIIEQRKTFSMLMNVHILIAIVVLLLCESIGIWFLYNKLVIPNERLDAAFWVMQFSIYSAAISIIQVPYNASVFGHERMNIYAYIGILESLLKLTIVTLLLYVIFDKLIAYAFLTLLSNIIIALIYIIYCKRKFCNCHYLLYWSKDFFKKVFGYTSWSLIGNLAWTLNGQGMNILINLFFGPVFNAARGIASSVEAATTSFLYNFLGASVPQIIKAYAAGDMEYMERLSYKSSKFGFLLFMCLSIPLISSIDWILQIWLVTPPPISGTLCVLSLVYIQCNSMSGTLQNVVQATGQVRNYQLLTGTIKLMALPIVYALYLLGFPVYFYLIVLIVVAISVLFAHLYIIKGLLPLYSIKNFLLKVNLPELLAWAGPLTLALFFWRQRTEVLHPIVIIIMMALVSIISMWLVGLNTSERLWIKNIIYSRIENLKRG